MNTLVLDTHAAIKRLTASGISEPQAEAIVASISEARDNDLQALATKSDLRDFELRVDARFEKTNGEINLLKWMQGFTLAAVMVIFYLLIKH